MMHDEAGNHDQGTLGYNPRSQFYVRVFGAADHGSRNVEAERLRINGLEKRL